MTDAITRLTAALEGRYAIERELGQGGMATVYLADDLRHERKVALKVLKPELAAVVGAERFLAEIKTTANLQHPHILPLFDSGEAGGFLFYVMPYIEGETLRDRIDREKQLPVDEALGIATAVANALQTAHDHGVIHRDIKPGNILLSRGEPLVADFGIAIAVGAAGGSRLTETGLSVGTPYYMSPEQATGDQMVGPASDTYALACVLYEMLVGEPPYLGNTAQAVLGKIIQGIPVSATTSRKAVPLNVDAAIRKALEKIPADRFASAGQFAKALAEPSFRHGELRAPDSVVATRWKGVAMASGLVAALALVAAGWGWARAAAPEPVVRQQIVPLTESLPRPLGAFTALAPDGSSMVYARMDDDGRSWALWLKPRDAAEATLLPGTANAQNVTYSPDGEWIAFVSGNALRKRPVGDGSTVAVAENLPPTAPTSQVALAWLDDGSMLYELPGPTLMRVSDAGGRPDTVVVLSDLGYAQLSFAGALPGSEGALLAVCSGSVCGSSPKHLVVADFLADTVRVLIDDVVRGWYTPTGHLMYVRSDGAVFAAPFDLGALELTGPGIPLFDGVSVTVTSPELVVGWDGTVLYGQGAAGNASRALVWVDRAGNAEEVDPNLDPGYAFRTAALSPTGDRIALTGDVDDLVGNAASTRQLWVKELPDGPITRLTNDEGYTRRPTWSPDGRTIAYVTNEGGLSHARSIRADGSSESAFDVLLQREAGVFEVLYTSDASRLVFREGDTAAGAADLMILDLGADTVARALLASDFNEAAVALSPDNRWMAYESNASGRLDVFVRPFPTADSRIPISTNGGSSPVWAHNGRELFYVDADGWMTVATYEAAPTLAVTGRERLFNVGQYFAEGFGWRLFDVALDDQRLLMIAQSFGTGPAADEASVIYVQNYWRELNERVGR